MASPIEYSPSRPQPRTDSANDSGEFESLEKEILGEAGHNPLKEGIFKKEEEEIEELDLDDNDDEEDKKEYNEDIKSSLGQDDNEVIVKVDNGNIVKVKPPEPEPVAQAQTNSGPERKGREYDAYRQASQLFDLLRKEAQLTREIDNTWFFGKAKLKNELQMVQRDISNHHRQFPELASLTLDDASVLQGPAKAYKSDQIQRLGTKNLNSADQAKRQQLLNEIMAGELASMRTELRDRTRK